MRPLHITSILITLTFVGHGGASELRTTLGLAMSTQQRAEILHERFLENRRSRFDQLRNPYKSPKAARVVEELPAPWKSNLYPWHPRVCLLYTSPSPRDS